MLFHEQTKTINAKLFHDRVERALSRYCIELERASWNADIWKKFRKKLKAVCKNCGT